MKSDWSYAATSQGTPLPQWSRQMLVTGKRKEKDKGMKAVKKEHFFEGEKGAGVTEYL